MVTAATSARIRSSSVISGCVLVISLCTACSSQKNPPIASLGTGGNLATTGGSPGSGGPSDFASGGVPETSGTAHSGASSGGAPAGGSGSQDAGRPTDAGEPVILTIQESTTPNKAGFVGISGTGSISTSTSASVSGWTGNGYIQSTDRTSNVIYSVHAEQPCTATLHFHYAFGGSAANLRDAWMILNGAKVQVDTDSVLEFPYTAPADGGKWNVYADTAGVTLNLIAGDNQIRLMPNTDDVNVKGLANIDYMQITGVGISAGTNSATFYKLAVSVPDAARGNVSISPLQDFYLGGTSITLAATAQSSYQFESWTGSAPSTAASYTFNITADTTLAARFLQTGATQPTELVGFGAVQDDNATPYILTGGNEGKVVAVEDLASLQAALSSPNPYVIKISGTITSGSETVSTSIDVASNKTIYGDGTGHLKNIELKFSGDNYIVRNLIVSEVVAADMYGGTGNDAIQLNGAHHVWIDHCELYSSLTVSDPAYTGEAKDYYDGLLDIKNGASFVTISNNYFHDHWKAILIGSGDDAVNAPTDAKIRVTVHHNYFKDISSRMPLIRYGKAHIFNNVFKGEKIQLDSTVNARCASEVFVQGNYTENAKYTVAFLYDTSGFSPGTWNLLDNSYVNCVSPNTTSTGAYSPTYTFSAEASSGISASVPLSVGVGVILVP